MLVNFDTSKFTALQWIFFILATFLQPIVMLNMLISIMGDTYSRVKNQYVAYDYQEKAKLVYETERLMFWKGNN